MLWLPMVATTSESGFSSQPAQADDGRLGGTPASAREAVHDAALVARFNSGDEAAFVEIVDRYRGKVHSIALGHLRNHADADEITQDTFIRAHRGLSRFRGDSSLSTWLHRVAFNLSRNRCKYYCCRRQYAMLSIDRAFNDDNSATFSDLIASDAPDPAREATAGEFSELVASCMRRLGAHQREILLLRNGLNESYDDIAKALGISIGTVKSRIGRARECLRKLLAESYPEADPGDSRHDWFGPIRSGSMFEAIGA
jgi:RNA polymerase sigma-70 factor (ECF subfamily)